MKRIASHQIQSIVYEEYKLKKVCERCGLKEDKSKTSDGRSNIHIHHKDKDRFNNSLNNIEILCSSCHVAHHKKGKPSWNKGKTNVYSKETLQKMKKSGENISNETRKKMSESHKGQKAWNKGKPRSEETKRKISETKKAKKPANK